MLMIVMRDLRLRVWDPSARTPHSAARIGFYYSTAGPMIAPWKLRALPFWLVTLIVMN